MVLKCKNRWIAILLASILLFTNACTAASSEGTDTEEVQKTIFVTQIVTLIVATPLPTEPLPPPTQFIPTPTRTSPPTIPGDIYYPIPGCVASRLHIGDIAYVVSLSGNTGMHIDKDVQYSPTLYMPELGEQLEVKKGPWCWEGKMIIWLFRTIRSNKDDEIEGYMAEGDGEYYWILPVE